MDLRINVLHFETLESRRLLASSPQLIHDNVPFCRRATQSTERAVAYFAVTDECGLNNGAELLWQTDGTREGTFDLGGFGADAVGGGPGPDDSLVFESGGDVYWSIIHFDAPGSGQLFRSDRTANSAVGISAEGVMYEVNGHVLFVPSDNLNDLRRVTDNGSESLLRFESISEVVVVGDVGIFWADNKVWRTDGTPEGTKSIAELRFDPSEFFFRAPARAYSAGTNRVLIAGNVDGQFQVWSTDGTALTQLDLTHSPSRFTVGGLRFIWPISVRDRSIRVTDGESITEIAELERLSRLVHAEEIDGKLYFSTDGGEFWMTDATEGGTRRITAFENATSSFFQVNDDFLFVPRFDLQNTIYERVHRSTGETTRFEFDPGGTLHVLPKAAIYTPRFAAQSNMSPLILRNDSVEPVGFGSLGVGFRKHVANLQDVVLLQGRWGYWVTDGTKEGTYKVSELVRDFDDEGNELRENVLIIDAFQVSSEKAVLSAQTMGDPGFATRPLYSIDLTRPDELQSDINHDGVVNFDDFLILSANYTDREVAFEDGDIDRDSQVTRRDFELLVQDFGQRRAK